VNEGALQDRVVLITGAARGLGLAMARAVVQAGGAVVLLDREVELGVAAAAALDPSGAKATFFAADVTDEPQMAAAVAHAVERFGRLDAAINNAGILGPLGPTLTLSPEDFDRVIEVNVVGTFLGMKHQLLHFRQQKRGSIINVASVNGLVGSINAAAYAASKHAVLGLTKSAALEVAALGVRVNALCPGPFETPLLRASQQENLKLVAQRSPMRRVGRPEELGAAVVYLCSDQSSYLTGQTVVIDGGLLA
jgi:NAD(P)-dependent dehydrogenase (short-subunit alcohol dehydrogenase family)